MAHFILKEPWTLRGFLNSPYVLIDPSGENEYPVRPLNEILWNTVVRCNGVTEMKYDGIVAILLKSGLISSIDEHNARLTRNQEYRCLPFELKPTVQFSITGRCNMNCLHCFMAANASRNVINDDLSEKQLLDIVDQLPECGVREVELTGGEPLVSPHFRSIVERLSLRHIAVTRILTNGLLLNDDLLDFLISHNQRPEIVISFDGLGTHNWLRNQSNAEECAIAAMKLVVKRGFILRCTININSATVSRIVETCRFLKELGAESLFLIRTMETPRWSENAWVDDSLPLEDYYEAAIDVARADINEHWGVMLQVFNGFMLSFTPEPTVGADVCCDRYESCFHKCGRAASSFFISHTGKVWPCDAFEGIGMAGGFFDGASLATLPLIDILSDSTYADAMSITLNDIRSANDDCRECAYFDRCAGGCRAYGYGSSMYHEAGYAKGNGRLTNKALTHCVFYRGGYADRVAALVSR